MKRLFFVFLLFMVMGPQSFAKTYNIVCHEGENVCINLTELFSDVDPDAVEGEPIYYTVVVNNGITIEDFTVDEEGYDYYVLLNIQREQSGTYTFTQHYSNVSISRTITIVVLPNHSISLIYSYLLIKNSIQWESEGLKPRKIAEV